MYEKERAQIVDSLRDGAAKSWIIVGPHGVGKEDFAKNVVKVLTHDFNEYNPCVQWISCGLTDAAKKEIQKAILAGEKIEDKEWATKTEITVDDVREGCHFLSLKSNKIKILVFNLADDMNENAQNALLKTLEEPYPNTLILLLCENIGKLVRTILSRCQKITLKAPSKEEFKKELLKTHPELSETELDLLSFLADNVPGMGKEIVEQDGLAIFDRVQHLFVRRDQLDAQDLLLFSEQVSKNENVFDLTQKIILKCLTALAEKYVAIDMEKAYKLSNLYEEMKLYFTQIDSMNLDKKQALVSIVYQISEAL
ncbi:MAG: hypothetical protein II938_03785 [Alphaproteobacteria bacterium]|nr:hypothetical protein [Alphaproteobacteria bacterium]